MATIPETITLQLKAKHFNGARYLDNCGCGLANAAKEHFGIKDVYEKPVELRVGDSFYQHAGYWADNHAVDSIVAKWHKYDETVIREIVLTPIQ